MPESGYNTLPPVAVKEIIEKYSSLVRVSSVLFK